MGRKVAAELLSSSGTLQVTSDCWKKKQLKAKPVVSITSLAAPLDL